MARQLNREISAMRRVLSYVLQIGVTIAAFFIAIGMIYNLYFSSNAIVDHTHLTPTFTEPTPAGLPYMLSGIILVICLPLVRVLICGIMFCIEKNWRYVLISLFLLAALCYSLVLEQLPRPKATPTLTATQTCR